MLSSFLDLQTAQVQGYHLYKTSTELIHRLQQRRNSDNYKAFDVFSSEIEDFSQSLEIMYSGEILNDECIKLYLIKDFVGYLCRINEHLFLLSSKLEGRLYNFYNNLKTTITIIEIDTLNSEIKKSIMEHLEHYMEVVCYEYFMMLENIKT